MRPIAMINTDIDIKGIRKKKMKIMATLLVSISSLVGLGVPVHLFISGMGKTPVKSDTFSKILD
jgi:hypothetical protein